MYKVSSVSEITKRLRAVSQPVCGPVQPSAVSPCLRWSSLSAASTKRVMSLWKSVDAGAPRRSHESDMEEGGGCGIS